MKNNKKEFKYFIITEMYLFIKKDEIKTIGTILDAENNNISTNRNTMLVCNRLNTNASELLTLKNNLTKKYKNAEYEKKIIEDEDYYQYKTFEQLKINLKYILKQGMSDK